MKGIKIKRWKYGFQVLWEIAWVMKDYKGC